MCSMEHSKDKWSLWCKCEYTARVRRRKSKHVRKMFCLHAFLLEFVRCHLLVLSNSFPFFCFLNQMRSYCVACLIFCRCIVTERVPKIHLKWKCSACMPNFQLILKRKPIRYAVHTYIFRNMFWHGHEDKKSRQTIR